MSFLEGLRAPSASELGRKRKIDANPHIRRGRSAQHGELSESVVSFHSFLIFCEEFLENNRTLTGE